MPEESNSQLSQPCYNARYDNTVDEKRRVQIPSKWRTEGQAESEFMLILWPSGAQKDACLMVLPPPVAQRLKEKVNALPFGDPQAEALRRFLGRKSDIVVCDKAGRITLPELMTKAVGIEKQAVLIGMFDRFQIWNPKRYEEVTRAEDALAAEAFKLI
jgi:MraZ protein